MRNKLAAVAILLWAATAVAAGFLFVKGHTAPGSDGRVAILLASSERDYVLREMRRLLSAVRDATAALGQGDRARFAAAARVAATHEAGGPPLALMAKLPMEFKNAGMAMHAGFADLAAAAERGDKIDALTLGLSEQISTCVACHESFRLD